MQISTEAALLLKAVKEVAESTYYTYDFVVAGVDRLRRIGYRDGDIIRFLNNDSWRRVLGPVSILHTNGFKECTLLKEKVRKIWFKR